MLRRSLFVRFAGVLLLAPLALVAGCGDDRFQKTYTVTGQVLVDGQPVSKVAVRFIPKDKSKFKMGETPQATTDDEGRFTLSTYNSGDGAPAGEYFVAVAEPDQVQTDENDDTRPVGLGKQKKAPKVPPKYQVAQNSGVTATVERKDNALAPFQLTRAGK